MPSSDLLFLSLESWDDIWRRNQFFCAEYARRHPEAKILFVTPPRDVSAFLRRREFHKLKAEPVWSPPGLPNIHVFRPDKLLPNSVELGRRANIVHLRRQIRHAMRQLSIENPILWINDHSAADLLGTLGESASLYDITDDWISFDQPAFLQERIRKQDETLCRNAGAVIVCSDRLFEMKRPIAKNLHLIPNGVDAHHYAQVLDAAGPLPAAAQKWQQPVFGYTGSVHGERVDLNLLAQIARTTPGTFVLIGPNMLQPAEIQRLSEIPNLILHGPVPYRDLPQYMRAFTACIVPHKVSEFTESLNPIKLWEYLAAGKPIVATPVAGFRDYPNLVHLASGPDAFVNALQKVVDEEPAVSDNRRAEARRHSWASRVDHVESVLAALCSGDRSGEERLRRAAS